jgi:hypothetical protein
MKPEDIKEAMDDAEVTLPLYAFKFDAFDRKEDDDGDGYKSRARQVDVTVIATSEDEALEDVKNLLVREHYALDEITELTDLNVARTTRW